MFKYVDFIGAEAFIGQNTLKFSSPSSFNDPFEFHDGLVEYDISKKYFKEIIKKRTNDNSRIKRQLAIFEKDKEDFVKNLIDQFQSLKRETKICCFSATSSSILMWSHYSQCHSGICIQFDEKILSDTFNKNSLIANVKYARNLKPLNFSRYKNQAVDHMVLTKSKDWKYEKEKRIILGGNPDEFQTIPARSITKVILGCKTSKDHVGRIIDLIEKKEFDWIRISKMEIDTKSYRLIEKYLSE